MLKKEEREDRLSSKKKKKNNNSIQYTRGWENIKFSFYSKDYVEHCFILLFMNFIFFLALKHIYAAASFPPVPVQHEYSQSPYRLQMCTHTHTHRCARTYITPKCLPLEPWELIWLENFQTFAEQMLGMILCQQHQENSCVGLVSSPWNNSELIYSEHLTQTSSLSHQILNIQTFKRP